MSSVCTVCYIYECYKFTRNFAEKRRAMGYDPHRKAGSQAGSVSNRAVRLLKPSVRSRGQRGVFPRGRLAEFFSEIVVAFAVDSVGFIAYVSL